MSIEKTTFQQEQNELLEYLVNNLIYPRFNIYEDGHSQSVLLELFITSDCNKNCEYCYLQKNKDLLYPKEYNDFTIIKNNCKILLKYYLEKNIKIKRLDLFSGEIVGTQLWIDIIRLIEQYSIKGLEIKTIMVPTNGYFLVDDDIRNNIENIIRDLKNNGIRLIFSFSDDGGLLDETNRPLNNQAKQDKEKFYTEVKKFANKYGYGFHPMVNANGIHKWAENFKWWKDFTKDIQAGDVYSNAMFLEVRNDEWTDENIEEYLKFLKIYIESIPETFNSLSKKDMIQLLCHKGYLSRGSKKYPFSNNYQPFGIECGKRISCAITQNFCVRLGDLAICPCHRTAYNHLLYGKYKIENNKITGIEANNIQLFLNNMVTGYNGFLKCDSCPINGYCLKGCRGAQYEVFKDVNCPIPSVCNLMKVKAMFCFINIIYLSKKYEMTEDIKSYLDIFSQILDELKNEDEEFFNKWKNVIYRYLLEI